MPESEGGVCYRDAEVVKENYQMCDVTNVKIVEILEGKKPQVTFTCEKDDDTCAFQCKAQLLTLNPANSYSLGR
jgi:ATP-binding cassette subfamily G (WHITE) protein 2